MISLQSAVCLYVDGLLQLYILWKEYFVGLPVLTVLLEIYMYILIYNQ